MAAAAVATSPVKSSVTQSAKKSGNLLDVVRIKVGARILAQDAMWSGPSVYVPLPSPIMAKKETGQMSWQLPNILPAAGLQCIISIPPSAAESLVDHVDPLSVSSESCARTVWHALTSQHAAVSDNTGEPQDAGDMHVLEQSASWKAFVMPGRPESHSEPTLSMPALETLYRCLPQLTPSRLTISSSSAVDSGSRAKRRRAKKLANELVVVVDTSGDKVMDPGAAASEAVSRLEKEEKEAVVSYGYSLHRPGHQFAEIDGYASKIVPVYNAQEIFGLAAATTVIPWLLQLPMSSSPLAVRYVGVVALPCTAELATQLHRLVVYAQ
ncbi:hypothetical protein GGF42_005863 [Coemansia sp. RSA 2424]|nr:hypothetical protein GGF42_005863 [Coemansia sp. RSA 2424]